MRENMGLYRGKLKNNGKWTEGNLVVNRRGICVITPDETQIGTYGQVIPETVGQCIGEKDINGEMIFEGDILYDYANNDYCLVVFQEGGFDIVEDNVCWHCQDCSMSDFEKISNVHDNPELLGSA